MLRGVRIIVGVLLVGLILHLATLATRDCTVGLYVYDDCLWVWLREQLGLPASKFLRAAVLELVGLALLIGLYLTFRFVFPFWNAHPATHPEQSQDRTPDSPAS